MIRKLALTGLISALGLVMSPFAAKAEYPEKPVKIVVPVAAGGGVDTIARLYAAHMSKAMGQQYYVENRAGAGNIIGIEAVARSPADSPCWKAIATSITCSW